MDNKYFKVGVIFALTSVIFGAFGAHLLKDLLSVIVLDTKFLEKTYLILRADWSIKRPSHPVFIKLRIFK